MTKNLDWQTPVQYLKGVGPRLGDVLAGRGIRTVGQLLEWYPRAYQDRRAARSISSLQAGQLVSLTASVLAVRSQNLGRSQRKMYDVLIGDHSGRISCKYFRVPYRGYFERFSPQQKVRVSGKVTLYRGRLEFHHPDLELLGEEGEDTAAEDALLPIYTEAEGLSLTKTRKLMDVALNELDQLHRQGLNAYEEFFPTAFREKYRLLSRGQALRGVHQPGPGATAAAVDSYLSFRSDAHRRIIFEEFFWMELHLAAKRSHLKRETAPALKTSEEFLQKFKTQLAFQLTSAQARVVNEICADLREPHPMHRLVQGDVGSGKTVVAFLAAAISWNNGHQSALMAPTEILAEQHFRNAEKILSPLGMKVVLLTGQLKGKAYDNALAQISSGEAHLAVGTHALIEEAVAFKTLGLVIVDEQHRFGVEQRARLRKDGSPHFLVMTATPIPRTLAMTVYGDLDVSVIDELPPGRTPIVTKKVFPSGRDKVFSFLTQEVSRGRQAYIIYPLVEESEKIDMKAAVTAVEDLRSALPGIRFGLLHGKMKPQEKDQVMTQFRNNEFQVLVSTTVVEVGVDVPNANLIIIEHAERFGLSQLHQLRGRVGRGQHKSYCVLMLGHALSDESRQRAEVIESTTDGFRIAEADLEMRGPGEFLGQRQSGLPGFHLANLVRDVDILQEARSAARDLLAKDPKLTAPGYESLRGRFRDLDVVG
jgi:ATP-dependent DNA helicase RecG